MKKLACLILPLLLSPLLSFADPVAPSAVLDTYRTWVKPGHSAAFDKALKSHIKQFHNGEWKWRVYDVLTGPDGGALQITEGPHTWTEYERRGDLGEKHMRDYEMNILPHVEKTSPESYVSYKPEYSTTAVGNYSTKATITHLYTKPGQMSAFLESLKQVKPAWEKLGLNIVVYTSFASGEPQVILVNRLKDGFKDFEPDGTTFREAYDAINGVGSYAKRMEEQGHYVERIVGEIIAFRPEFSAK